jgi:hypothetical protein
VDPPGDQQLALDWLNKQPEEQESQYQESQARFHLVTDILLALGSMLSGSINQGVSYHTT